MKGPPKKTTKTTLRSERTSAPKCIKKRFDKADTVRDLREGCFSGPCGLGQLILDHESRTGTIMTGIDDEDATAATFSVAGDSQEV
jgi:hypothetical protein